MFYKPLNEVDLSDLQLLVSNKVKEGIQLDYKLKFPDNSDKGKVEFLRDISAFANTNGGYLIYGIKEEEIDGKRTGVAEEIIGIEGLNTNELKLWTENLIRTNIEPRFVGLEFQEIPVSDSNSVLIIRVPRSWNLPHVVSFGNHWRFYARNSAGNYQMDVTQLRDSFVLGSAITERLEAKRKERLSEINRNYQIDKANPLPVLVIHIQSFDSLRPDNLIDLSIIKNDFQNLTLGNGARYDPKFNFDGLLIGSPENYLQIFHSGMIEELYTGMFGETDKDEKYLDATYLDRTTLKAVGWRLALLRQAEVNSPLMIQIAILGIQNHKLQARYFSMGNTFSQLLPNIVDRADLIVKPIFIDSLANLNLQGSFMKDNHEVFNCWLTAEKLLKPAFDLIWNAFSFERCLYYNEDGEKVGSIVGNFRAFWNV